jgi:CBS domain-containing protein
MSSACPFCGAKNLEGVDECCNCGADLRDVDLPRPETPLEAFVMQRPLASIHLSAPRTISPDDSLADAVKSFADENLGLLNVIDENNQLVGVLSVRDVMTRVGPNYKSKLRRPVREFMTKSPVTLPSTAPIAFALNKMDVGGYRHVPVVDDNRLTALASARDVLRVLVKPR